MTGDALHQLRQALSRMTADQRAALASSVRQGAPSPEDWVSRTAPTKDPRARLFCFPYAGGGAAVYRGWQNQFPDDVEVLPVQLPGREGRLHEQPFRRMDELVPALADGLAAEMDVPFAFFGHSMGALIAFELTHYLAGRGGTLPTRLFLSAFRAPHLPNPNIRIYHLPDEVLKTVLKTEGTPADVLNNDELMRKLLPTLRADFELCDTYEYVQRAPLQIPVDAFGGYDDVRVSADDIAQWRTQCSSEFTVTMLPGSHFFVNSARDLVIAAVTNKLHTSSNTNNLTELSA